MDVIEEFDRIANFYVCYSVSYYVQGPIPMRVAKAKGWSVTARGEKRRRYDLWIIEYTDGVKELYRHVSGMKPEMFPSPTVGDIIAAFDSVKAKTRKDVIIRKAEPKEVYEQLRLFY